MSVNHSHIIEAVCEGDAELVATLLLAGADPNHVEDQCRVTPLHHAAQRDDTAIVEMLILAGADIFAVTAYDDMTPLEVACLNENWHVAALLAHIHQYLYCLTHLALAFSFQKNLLATPF